MQGPDANNAFRLQAAPDREGFKPTRSQSYNESVPKQDGCCRHHGLAAAYQHSGISDLKARA